MKTLLVTGGSSGIGAAVVKKFLDNGYLVVNLDIKSNSQFDQFDHYTLYQLDLTDFELLKQTLVEIHQKFSISCIVLSAGRHLSANIENITDEEYHAIMRLNCDVNFYVLKYSIQAMKESGGTVIFIGSDQTVIAKPNSVAYMASKRAAEGLVMSLVPDYAKDNIRVVSLAVGTVDTPLYRDAIRKYSTKSGISLAEIEASEALLQPIGRIGNPDEIAEMVHFVADSQKTGYLTGSRITLDGGYTTI